MKEISSFWAESRLTRLLEGLFDFLVYFYDWIFVCGGDSGV